MEEFTKFHGDDVAKHWQRLEMLTRAAEPLRLFSAPTPLRIKEDGKSIAYEPLPPGRMLVTVLLRTIWPGEGRKHFARETVFRVGEALAALHHEKVPPGRQQIRDVWLMEPYAGSRAVRIAEDMLAESPVALYHGDFGHGNVWISDDRKIWFYDPIPSPFAFDPDALTASIYFDIGHMVACLWAVYPLRLYPFVPALDRARWISLFLAGYERQAGILLNRTAVKLVAIETLLGFAEYVYQRSSFPKRQVFRYLIRHNARRLYHAEIGP